MNEYEIIMPIIGLFCAVIVFIIKKYRPNCRDDREHGCIFDFHNYTERDDNQVNVN